MKKLCWLVFSAVFLSGVPASFATEAAKPAPAATVAFNRGEYVQRQTSDGSMEFVPRGQETSEQPTDLLVVTHLAAVQDDKTLANAAGRIHDNLKANRGLILKAGSMPKVKNKPVEFLIVGLRPTKEFAELSMTRVLLRNGAGVSVAFLHREYGDASASNRLEEWMKSRGELMEKALLAWDRIPNVSMPAAK